MTCKDCAWFDVCYKVEHYGRDTETTCQSFKNKADFVEVVRCKDCKHWNSIGFAENGGWCEKTEVGTIYNHFCSYGERRDT